jgi:hypothetical protein
MATAGVGGGSSAPVHPATPRRPRLGRPHDPPAGASPAAGLSLDRTGNGRPSQTRDLVKRWVAPGVVPFPKQKYWQAKLAGVKVGRSSIASPTNTSAPRVGERPYRSESCWYGN